MLYGDVDVLKYDHNSLHNIRSGFAMLLFVLVCESVSDWVVRGVISTKFVKLKTNHRQAVINLNRIHYSNNDQIKII